MARRLTHEESRAIKRTMRATPRISQRMHDGWLADDGRFVIKAGKPPIGQLLEATKSTVGKWSVQVVDMWEADVSDTSRQSSAHLKDDPKKSRAGYRMSRGLKIFLVLLLGYLLLQTISDTFYTVPFYALPILAVLLVAIVLLVARISRAQ